MAITIADQGSIFESGCQTLVNPVNLSGLMNTGLALEFKKRYPGMFETYMAQCRKGPQWGLRVGNPSIYRLSSLDRNIVLFPTREHWNRPTELEWVMEGIKTLRLLCGVRKITSIAFPALGCGGGGLSWGLVRPVMEYYLRDWPIPVTIFAWKSAISIPDTPNHE